MKARQQFWTSATKFALEQNFNTINIPGVPTQTLWRKKHIAEFENDLRPPQLRIREARSLADDHDRDMLMFFMALLTIKNTRIRKMIGSFMGDVATSDLESVAATLSPARQRAFMRSSAKPPNVCVTLRP